MYFKSTQTLISSFLTVCFFFGLVIDVNGQRDRLERDLKRIEGLETIKSRLPSTYSELYRLDFDSIPVQKRETVRNLIEVSRRYSDSIVIEKIVNEFGNDKIDWNKKSDLNKIRKIVTSRINSDTTFEKIQKNRERLSRRIGVLSKTRDANNGLVRIPKDSSGTKIIQEVSNCIECDEKNDMASPGAYLVYLISLLTEKTSINTLTNLEDILYQKLDSLTFGDVRIASYVALTNEILENKISGKNSTTLNKRDSIYNHFNGNKSKGKYLSSVNSSYPYPDVIENMFYRLAGEFDVDVELAKVLVTIGKTKEYADSTNITVKAIQLIATQKNKITYLTYNSLKNELRKVQEEKAEEEIKNEELLFLKDSLLYDFGQKYRDSIVWHIEKKTPDAINDWFGGTIPSLSFDSLEYVIQTIKDSVAACVTWEKDFCNIVSNSNDYPLRPLKILGNLYNSELSQYQTKLDTITYSDELLEKYITIVATSIYNSRSYDAQIEIRRDAYWQEAIQRIEKGFHTQIRENLIHQIWLRDTIDRDSLSRLLALDLKMAESYETTDLSFAILRLQTLMQMIELRKSNIKVNSSDSIFYSQSLRYLNSYGLFHAGKQVAVYPENFMEVLSTYQGSDYFREIVLKNIKEVNSVEELDELFTRFETTATKVEISFNNPICKNVIDSAIIYPGICNNSSSNSGGTWGSAGNQNNNSWSAWGASKPNCAWFSPYKTPQNYFLFTKKGRVNLQDSLFRIGCTGKDTTYFLNDRLQFENNFLSLILKSEFFNSKGDFQSAFKLLQKLYESRLNLAIELDVRLFKNMNNPQIENNNFSWLENPFDPFGVAWVDKSIFIDLIIKNHVENLLDWADQEFAQDSPESINRARELYLSAQEILSELTGKPDACGDCIENMNNAKVPSIEESVREIGCQGKQKEALKIYNSNAYSEGIKRVKLALLYYSCHNEKPSLAERNGMREVFSIAFSSNKCKHLERQWKGIIELSTERVDEIYKKLNKLYKGCAKQDLSNYGEGLGFNLSDAINIFSAPPLNPKILDLFASPEVAETMANLSPKAEVGLWLGDNHNFCIRKNSMYELFEKRICVNLKKIRTNRNFAGYERNLAYYAAPIDPQAAIQQAQSNPGAVFSASQNGQNMLPPIYRYSYLIDRAKQQAQYAISLESNMLNAYKELDAAEYSLLQARNSLDISQANVGLQLRRVSEAETSINIAMKQDGKSDKVFKHYEALLLKPKIDLENQVLAGLESMKDKERNSRWIQGFVGVAQLAGGIVSTAAGQGLVGGGISSMGSGIGQISEAINGKGEKSAEINLAQTKASFERREQEWQFQKDLAAIDQQITQLGIDLANDRLDIVQQERRIADLQAEHATDQLEFLTNGQFTNTGLYRWMSGNLRRLYQGQLNRAVATAKAAQDALAFEQQATLNKINSNYWVEDKRGLLGAEELMDDIEELETYRLQSGERKKEITKIISVANSAPEAFQEFVQSGELFFDAPMSWFDRDFPGHYLRMINNVSVTIVALTGSGQGIHATLSNNGMSRIVVDPYIGEASIVYRQPESVALSQTTNANGLFQLVPNDPLLYPFEGTGVATSWTLEMPKGANPIDFESIVDVIFTINYTAKESRDYRSKVLQDLGQDENGYVKVSANRFFSLAEEFPDAWYYMQNPDMSTNANYFPVLDTVWTNEIKRPWQKNTFVFELNKDYFIPNEEHRKITKITLLPIFKEGLELQANNDSLGITIAHVEQGKIPSNGEVKKKHSKRLKPLDKSTKSFNGQSPYGYWAIEIRDGLITGSNTYGAPVPDHKTKSSDLQDIIFIVEYSAKIHYPHQP